MTFADRTQRATYTSLRIAVVPNYCAKHCAHSNTHLSQYTSLHNSNTAYNKLLTCSLLTYHLLQSRAVCTLLWRQAVPNCRHTLSPRLRPDTPPLCPHEVSFRLPVAQTPPHTLSHEVLGDRTMCIHFMLTSRRSSIPTQDSSSFLLGKKELSWV